MCVTVPVATPPAVTSTTSISQAVSVPPAVQDKSTELEVTLETANAVGAGQTSVPTQTSKSEVDPGAQVNILK